MLDSLDLVKLKIINCIQIGDKINTKTLAINKAGFYSSIERYLYGENREHTVIFVQNTIRRCIDYIKNGKDPALIKKLNEELKIAKTSLENLKETYTGDIKFSCEIDEVLDKIHDVV